MLRISRQIGLTILLLGLFAVSALLSPARSQIKVTAPPGLPADVKSDPAKDKDKEKDKNNNDFSDSLTLPKDPTQKRKLEACIQYVERENWAIAVKYLQELVELDTDVFADIVRKGSDGRSSTVWVSVQSEADRVIGLLSKEGRDLYRANNSGKAVALMNEAREKGDLELVRKVVRWYRHTSAGLEAATLLATWKLDRGRTADAAREFENILDQEGWDKVESSETLFKAALAFRQAANEGIDSDYFLAKEAKVWDAVEARKLKMIKVGGEERPPADLKEYLAKLPFDRLAATPGEHHYIGGVPSRTAQGIGGPAYLDKAGGQDMHTSDENRGGRGVVTRIMDAIKSRNQALITPYQPIAIMATVGGEKVPLIIYRDYTGLQAAQLQKGGKPLWASPSALSIDSMANNKTDPGVTQAQENFLQFYLSEVQRPSIILENSAVSTLTSDGTFVYMVEDFQLPPRPRVMQDQGWGQPMPNTRYQQKIESQLQFNQLIEFNASSGKVEWRLGGETDDKDRDPDNPLELADAYFLGPPLPLENKLYCLVEKNKQLRLLTLETYWKPRESKAGEQLKPLHRARIVSSQLLATVKNPIIEDVTRRSQASQFAYGEGILICPTNAGALMAFNLRTNRLLWAYAYRAKGEERTEDWEPGMGINRPAPAGWVRNPDGTMRPPMVNGNQTSQWKMTPPVIQDGKVVFTAPDARSITCLDLREGTRLWSRTRTDDELYMGGVFQGKVLVVGRKYVRGLDLKTGQIAWSTEVGYPSGTGAASNDIYYVPLKESVQHHEPGIAALDIKTGALIGTTRSPASKKEMPGNLVFFQNYLLSQTPTELAIYPQLDARLAEIDKAIGANPADLTKVYERGMLRLDRGDMAGSVEDLRRVLNGKPPKELADQAKEKLYVTLTDYLLRKFDQAEVFLPEYEALCKMDVESAPVATQEALKAEERRRKVKLLCLVARGKENQGKLIEAFEKYQECGALVDTKELFTVVDEPTIKAAPDVLSQGRIAAMIANARPEERKPLEERIAKKWQQLDKTTDIDELRRFVAVFGSAFAVGKEARLQLAERLVENATGETFVEAERHLSLLRNRNEPAEVRARAIESLARLYTRRGLMEDAAYFYRMLAKDFPKLIIRDGKTAEDLLNDLSTDKRFLPYLDEPNRTLKVGRMDSYQKGPGVPLKSAVYQFEHDGEGLPYFRRHQVGLEMATQIFRLTDRYTGELRLTNPLATPPNNANNISNIASSPTPDGPKFAYQTLGHLIVLPVGGKVYGIDPINNTKLWERDLQSQPGMPANLARDADGSIQFIYNDGFKQRLGTTGPLDGNAICMQTRDALLAVDPISGRTLWTRSDVGPRSHIFGDDKNLYVVEMGEKDTAASTRALRAYDGVAVSVPDFADQYQKRIHLDGNLLLWSDSEGKTVTVQLYDIRTGKTLWKQDFSVGSIVMRSEDPDLVGAVDSVGKFRVFSISLNREVLNGMIDLSQEDKEGKKTMTRPQAVYLLRDSYNYYVMVNGPADPEVIGGLQTNLQTNIGLRALPVNGPVYAFHAETGQPNWELKVHNETLMLDQFQEMPMLIFTANYNKSQTANARFNPGVTSFTASTYVYEKRTGNLKCDLEFGSTRQNFHSLVSDVANHKIELRGPTLTIVLPYQASERKEPVAVEKK